MYNTLNIVEPDTLNINDLDAFLNNNNKVKDQSEKLEKDKEKEKQKICGKFIKNSLIKFKNEINVNKVLNYLFYLKKKAESLRHIIKKKEEKKQMGEVEYLSIRKKIPTFNTVIKRFNFLIYGNKKNNSQNEIKTLPIFKTNTTFLNSFYPKTNPSNFKIKKDTPFEIINTRKRFTNFFIFDECKETKTQGTKTLEECDYESANFFELCVSESEINSKKAHKSTIDLDLDSSISFGSLSMNPSK